MSSVSILGSGPVGRAIATSLVRGGHEVTIVSRDANTATAVLGARVASYEKLSDDQDAYVIAVPGPALEELLQRNATSLDDRLLIDATNRIDAAHYSQLPLFRLHTPAARIARAWCTLGWENFVDPVIEGTQLDLLWCGSDGSDGQLVSELIRSSGLNPVRVGGLECDHILEYQTRLVLSLIFETGRSRKLGIKLLEGPNVN